MSRRQEENESREEQQQISNRPRLRRSAAKMLLSPRYVSVFLALASLLLLCNLHSWRSFLPPTSSASSVLPCHPSNISSPSFRGDLRILQSSWNLLGLSWPPASSPPLRLRIALFVKKWPFTSSPGGLERHALTLHQALAERGHIVHAFTTPADNIDEAAASSSASDSGASAQLQAEIRAWQAKGLYLHLFPRANSPSRLDADAAWAEFLRLNASSRFHIVHSESVALPPDRAKSAAPISVVSWHGISYEIIHSDIVRDLTRPPGEPRSSDLQKALSERAARVADEIRFFPSYAHHVATSDHAGDILREIYQIETGKVHVILNGIDEQRFRPDPAAGARFRAEHLGGGDAGGKVLVMGAAGRLVKDKGYPLLYDAFARILAEAPGTRLLLAGDGPWAQRFKRLAPANVVTLGALSASQLAQFYNAVDVFVDPTLRAQGLDHTLLEAMLCGKPVVATRFASITKSIIVTRPAHGSGDGEDDGSEMSYTFSPTSAASDSLIAALRRVIWDHETGALRKKGARCLRRASLLFTATRMAASYERLFLCITDERYCIFPP